MSLWAPVRAAATRRLASVGGNNVRRSASTNSLNLPHLVTGSPMPAIDPDTLTVLNMRFCPYAQRTILCLNAKEADYKLINCALMTRPDWLWEVNPLGKVPVLLYKGKVIYESLVTCEWVEEVLPGRPLHSADPMVRARDRMLVELFNKVIGPQMKIWFGWKIGQGAEHRAKHFAESMKHMQHFEKELDQRGTTFFAGTLPGWLDYMLWPWFERVASYGGVYQDEPGLVFPSEKVPLLSSWIEEMEKDPAVAQYALPTQVHTDFIKTLVTGSPNYDLIVDQ